MDFRHIFIHREDIVGIGRAYTHDPMDAGEVHRIIHHSVPGDQRHDELIRSSLVILDGGFGTGKFKGKVLWPQEYDHGHCDDMHQHGCRLCSG